MLQIECLNSKGRDLVLVPGWGSSADIFDPLLDALMAEFRVHRVVFDHSDWRKTSPAALNYTLIQCLRRQAPQRALWMGWSLGGLLATQLAAQAPEHVIGLITVAFNPCFVQRDDWHCAMPQAQFSRFQTDFSSNPEATLQRFHALQVLGATDKRHLLDLLHRSCSPLSTAYLSDLLTLLLEDVRPALAQLQLPVLHLLGKSDALVPASPLVELLPLLSSDASVHCYPGASHLPFISAADRVITDVLSWEAGLC
ncbi:alpha/beta fold hydrolase [Nitrincola sp.]|uniref:alpha/beta fold hydrolase n=1 Tax=Nitrincola sp. TaxID=1926584 RepID=UPI003A8E248A